MTSSPPILLTADSHPLLQARSGVFVLERVRRALTSKDPCAAYIGASNHDAPEFYEIFVLAMERAGLRRVRSIPSAPSASDLEWLAAADLILLAGGDPLHGWETMQRNGVADRVRGARSRGAALVGVSAGAMQLGLGLPLYEGTIEGTFGMVPSLVDVHDESNDWRRLRDAVIRGPARAGLAIPFGCAVLAHANGEYEAHGGPATTFTPTADGSLREERAGT